MKKISLIATFLAFVFNCFSQDLTLSKQGENVEAAIPANQLVNDSEEPAYFATNDSRAQVQRYYSKNQPEKSDSDIERQWLFHIGLAFPTGDLAKDANIGFSAGYNCYTPLLIENLSSVVALDFYYHNVESLNAVNFSVTGGARYVIPLNKRTKLFGEFALGVSVFRFFTNSYDTSDVFFAFCHTLEGGIMLNNAVSFSLKNSQLGSYKISAGYHNVTSYNMGDLVLCLGFPF